MNFESIHYQGEKASEAVLKTYQRLCYTKCKTLSSGSREREQKFDYRDFYNDANLQSKFIQ